VFLVTTAKSGPGARISTIAKIRNDVYTDNVTGSWSHVGDPNFGASDDRSKGTIK
jgi:hypothetical protein